MSYGLQMLCTSMYLVVVSSSDPFVFSPDVPVCGYVCSVLVHGLITISSNFIHHLNAPASSAYPIEVH